MHVVGLDKYIGSVNWLALVTSIKAVTWSVYYGYSVLSKLKFSKSNLNNSCLSLLYIVGIKTLQ